MGRSGHRTVIRAMRIGTETHTYGQTEASGLTAAQASERCVGGRPLLRQQIAAPRPDFVHFHKKGSGSPGLFHAIYVEELTGYVIAGAFAGQIDYYIL